MKQRQIQILDTALSILAESGSSGLTLRNIAERIGVSEPAIYKYFKSKDELLLNLYEYSWQKMSKAIKLAIETTEGYPKKIESFLQAFFEYLDKHRGVNLLLLSEALYRNEPHLKSAMGRLWSNVENTVKSVVAKAIEESERTSIDTNVLSLMIMGFIQANVTKSHLFGTPIADEEKIKNFVEILWRGISA
ncbi:TetR/AcrR family transcriptional regulator [Thermosulfidibacter takaii]|nr:TetR/AcrR family transcriptional regulator [Thermosulfidibacter takaii]